MGGEGHIADMVQRSKQNRELLRERRERSKRILEKMHEGSHSSNPISFSVEKLEKAEKEIAEKERADKMFYLRFTLIFLGVVFLITLLALWIW